MATNPHYPRLTQLPRGSFFLYGPRGIGIDVSWTMLLIAWPALVLFTIAAPGLPAGIGTALWSATLFSSTVGLEGQEQADFIATWIALSGGLPDMLRTATNCTGDGFTALTFDRFFDRFPHRE